VGDPLVDELLEARQDLEQLKQQFTENHPDVINAQARVDVLERQLAGRASGGEPADGEDSAAALAEGNTYSMALRNELENLKLDIQRLEIEEVRLREDIADIEDKVEAAFNRQQELTQLTRDYENFEQYYRTLLDNKLNTRLSSRVLRTHSANQYEILDPPRVPRHPYEPDPIRIVLFGICGGLMLGALFAAGLELSNDAFFSAESLEQSMDLPVLATIPVLLDERDIRRRKRRLFFAVGAAVLVLAMLVAFNIFVFDLVGMLRGFLNSVIQ